ncbi:hypothetical protein VaNZ11_008379 [Volvox africanus]|uniref:Uncharacterized protein n=1 Tax=Volvox africanus TaxID=51714 RepID=A0ABQ5S6X5_9CHLO|nr:hypothetical protein VaNZ11_008379 [Volvox africanus]
MLAEAHSRRAAPACVRGNPCHTTKKVVVNRRWIMPFVHISSSFVAPQSGRGDFTVAGAGVPDQGIYSVGSASEDALELAATKKNLREALAKIDILSQQVAIVEELQTQMLEQDELIAELEQLIESDKRKQDNEREALNAQVAAAQECLAATTSELEEARSRLRALPSIEQLQAELARLQDVEAKLQAKLNAAQMQAARLTELEALQEQQKLLQAQLQEQRDSRAALVRDLEEARQQLVAAQAAAAAARQEAQEAQEALARKVEELAAIEADIEAMRKTMNKGGKKGRAPKVPPARGGAGKGFASPIPTAARLPTGAENHLREELKQAQTELEQLQGTLDEREAQLQAAQSAVEFLTSQCKDQELQMMDLQAKLDETSAKLKERVAAEIELQQQVAALAIRLKAEANDKTTAVATLTQQLDSQCRERMALAAERDSLAMEVEGLRGRVEDLDERRWRQDAALGELDASLQDLRSEVETAQQLKIDLAILAEAFSAKEAELEAAQSRLGVAEGREEELEKQVVLAEDSLKSLTAMLSELQTTNTELAERFEALEASFRTTSEQRADAEARAMEMSHQLVEARDQAVALREQLSVKNKALAETAQALSEAQAAESSQRMAAQTLSERLAAEQAAVIKQTRDVETLREQVVVLNEQIAFLSGSESSVKKLQEALRRSDGELADLRNQLLDAQRQAQAADNSVGEKVKDMDRLQRELEAASAALVESESALALARRAAEATDSELRIAKRQAEAAATEVASMRAQVAALAGELTAVRQDRDAASRAEFESLRQLQSELAAEAVATLELLNKAESLVVVSSEQASVSNAIDVNALLQQARNDLDVQTELWESERQRSASLEREVAALSEQLRNAALGRRLGAVEESDSVAAAGGSGSMTGTLAAAFLNARSGVSSLGSAREMEAANVKLLEDLNVAKDSALSAKAEAEALQTQVQFLERELRSRDALISELRSNGVPRGSRQADNLVQQLKSLQEENTKLKQAAARQQQLLDRTKRFFEKKISPGNDSDLSVVAAGSAGGAPPRRGSGGSAGSSPSRNGV